MCLSYTHASQDPHHFVLLNCNTFCSIKLIFSHKATLHSIFSYKIPLVEIPTAPNFISLLSLD